MNWVDLIVLAVLAVSALLAFARGFAREALGIGAWLGAAIVAVWAEPLAEPQFRQWLGTPDLVMPVSYGAVFLVTLLVLLLVSHWISALIQGSVISGVDRTLGLAFGIVRGAAVLVFVYIVAGTVLPVEKWPPQVLAARSLPLVYQGAIWVVGWLPEDSRFRPKVPPPPAAPETTADSLIHTVPSGRAADAPPARQ
jgi:membrane protein required for colicin V production